MPSPQDLIGVELNGERGRYRLEKFLGEGLTANVYVATATWRDLDESEQVAVKVMRPGLGAQEASRYRAEATHLSELQGARAAAAPTFHERFKTGLPEAPEALALELMRGRQVVDLLRAEGPLAEQEGLSLGLQLAELLQTLHQIGRTYTDFKFENLWWQRDAGQLKVTDWNVLSERGQLERVSTDLLRASRYLYAVLTGGDAREQGGIVVTPFMQHPSWPSLSIACQSALRKGLHRYPDQRYQLAAEMVEEVQRVQRYWQDAPDGQLRLVRRRVEAPYNRTTFEQAREILDVLRKREAQGERFSPADQAQLDELWTIVDERLRKEQSAMEVGRHQFNGGSWQEAEKWFVQAVGDNPWDLAAWRWREAARAGLVTSEYQGYKDDVAEGVDALNSGEGEYERAEHLLARHAIPALSGLVAEARLRRLLHEGVRLATQGKALVDQGKGDTAEADDIFNRAQRAFLGAADALNAIAPKDYRDQLQQDPDIGDPAKRGRELVDQRRAAAAEAGRRLRSAEEKAQAGDWAGVAQDLTVGLEAVPGEARLLDASLRHGQEQLRSGRPQVASDLLALASRYEAPGARLWWRAAVGAAACSQLLSENRWTAGLDALDATLALSLDAEAQSAVAGSLQRALDAALEPAAASASLPELLRLLTKPASVARLDSGLASWADAIDQRWADLVAANIESGLPQSPLGVLEQAEVALKAAPSDVTKAQLAQRLVEPLTRSLALTPATGDADQSASALAQAERLLALSSELAASPWAAAVNAYRAELAQVKEMHREARFEEDQRLIESLMKAGDKDSLEQARTRLDEAQKLTPAGTKQSEGLAILAGRLAQLEDGLLSGTERRSRIDALQADFDARLAGARSETDFAALERELDEVQRQARSLQDSALIEAIAAKLAIEGAVWNRRGEAQPLEQGLADTRARIAAAETLAATPGGAAARDSLWRELNAIAAALLAIHPGHSDAVRAQQDYKQAVGALALHQRVAYVEAVTAELGEPLQQLRQADVYWRTAEPERARQALASLPADWQEMDRVQELDRRIEQGNQYLAAVQTLKSMDLLDERFDQELGAVLRMELPSDYLAKSGLVAWTQAKRTSAVQAWSGSDGRSATKAPRLLAQAVAADQAARLVDRAQQGGPWPAESPPLDSHGFVQQALARQGSKDNARGQAEALLRELPLTPQPAALGRQVGSAAKEQLANSGQERRARLLKVIAAVAGGLALLALLAAVAGWLWPGFLPNSRPSLLAAAATATANPPTPEIVRETVEVTVVVTATSLPTNTPRPTDTPMLTPTPTETPIPEPTEPPAYQDADRILEALAGISTAAELPDVTPVPEAPAITDVVALLDDGDEDVVFNQENILGAALTSITTLGTLGGMRYLDLASFTGTDVPLYAWPTVTLAPAGTYRLLVFIPNDNGTVEADYSVEQLQTDGQALSLSINQAEKRRINQKNYNNQWVDLGVFEVPEPGDLRVVAQALRGTSGTQRAAYDAVAIIRSQ